LEAGNVEPFSLSNDASPRTGFTALHAAASRGYLDIVIWCIESGGAMADLEDKEGETALHKAALNGHLPIIKYLLPAKADVNARDADGWTALHNACSKVTCPVTSSWFIFHIFSQGISGYCPVAL
jgi:ankyrin repeat protein